MNIDQPQISIAEYVAKIRGDVPEPLPGHVYEVHVSPDWDQSNFPGTCPLAKFMDDWNYLIGPIEHYKRPQPYRAFVGVVHPDGVCLVQL